MGGVNLNIGCVIMAAGLGRRFGGNKLLAPLAGKPVLLHVLDALPQERLARLAAVTRSADAAQLCQDRGAAVRQTVSGLLSESIRLGAEAMEGMDAALFVMGDQPLCTRASYLRMLDAFPEQPACVFRLCHQGRAGSPVLFPRILFPALKALTGSRGAWTPPGRRTRRFCWCRRTALPSCGTSTRGRPCAGRRPPLSPPAAHN